ncbi:MAG: hypothetical protein K2K34_03480 [Oscillospiraceae bacterium]|nr:hypothetical protein [Oscillospiraceae bacterium]
MKIEKRIGAALTASALALSLFAAPLENVPLSLGATVSAQEQVVSEYISVNTSSLPDSRELEQMYIDSLFYGGGFSFYKDYGKDHLTGASLEIYTLLRSKIEAVANGTAVETSFAVSMNEKFSDGNDLDSGLEKAINALMVDLPSNFYWYDKTVGYSYSYTSDGPKVTKLIFEVSENYRPANSKTETVNYSDGSSQTFHISVDSSKINAAKKAAQTAQEFANSCSDMSDYDKIIAFSDKICELTDYNHPAADDDSTPYGDPWQLVYVFDGDPDTKVVCEGYSKAFQYLCDLSGIDCYTVSGLADATDPNSGHMWNIVVLGGKSYLVDVTYKDSGWDTVLNGVEENTADGFIACNDTRKYDSDTLALYPSSVLTLSTEPYTPNVAANEVTISVTPGDGEIKVGEGIDFTVEVTSEEEISGYLDCTYDSDIVSVSDGTDSEDGTGTVYTVTGIAEGIATLTFEWTSDEIKLDEPCTVTCTVTVTAAECEHEWSKNWEKDADGHWQLCTKCGAKSDVEEHDEISADNGEDADCTKDR